MPEATNVGLHGPYEDLAIEIVKLIGQIVSGMDPGVKAEVSRMWLEDLRQWREFWRGNPAQVTRKDN